MTMPHTGDGIVPARRAGIGSQDDELPDVEIVEEDLDPHETSATAHRDEKKRTSAPTPLLGVQPQSGTGGSAGVAPQPTAPIGVSSIPGAATAPTAQSVQGGLSVALSNTGPVTSSPVGAQGGTRAASAALRGIGADSDDVVDDLFLDEEEYDPNDPSAAPQDRDGKDKGRGGIGPLGGQGGAGSTSSGSGAGSGVGTSGTPGTSGTGMTGAAGGGQGGPGTSRAGAGGPGGSAGGGGDGGWVGGPRPGGGLTGPGMGSSPVSTSLTRGPGFAVLPAGTGPRPTPTSSTGAGPGSFGPSPRGLDGTPVGRPLPVIGGPVTGGPVPGGPVTGAPVGGPATGSPVGGPVTGGPVIGGSVAQPTPGSGATTGPAPAPVGSGGWTAPAGGTTPANSETLPDLGSGSAVPPSPWRLNGIRTQRIGESSRSGTPIDSSDASTTDLRVDTDDVEAQAREWDQLAADLQKVAENAGSGEFDSESFGQLSGYSIGYDSMQSRITDVARQGVAAAREAADALRGSAAAYRDNEAQASAAAHTVVVLNEGEH